MEPYPPCWGAPNLELPLMRRQLMKLLLPSEQARTMMFQTADALRRADAGEAGAYSLARILTPLIKFRACRDAISAARASMETRGGNGYIEEWVNSRLVRDSHIGVLWEGTSNINAIDVVKRAVFKAKAHEALHALLQEKVAQVPLLPEAFRQRLLRVADKSFEFISAVAAAPESEHMARQATTAFYNAASAVVLAWESIQEHGDPRKLLISRFVLEHRLEPIDPLSPPDGQWEHAAYSILLSDEDDVTLDDTLALIAS